MDTRLRRAAAAVVVAAAVTAATNTRATQPDNTGWSVRAGTVRVVCPLTVGGSFDALTPAIAGAVGLVATGGGVSGEFTVDLTTLDTGIGLRNEHLRNNYLETGRGEAFAHAVLSDVRLAGFETAAPAGRGTFTGRLRLHGLTQQVNGKVDIQRTGATLKVRASFPVALPRFEIAKPRYLGVGVRDEVVVHVSLEMEPR